MDIETLKRLGAEYASAQRTLDKAKDSVFAAGCVEREAWDRLNEAQAKFLRAMATLANESAPEVPNPLPLEFLLSVRD